MKIEKKHNSEPRSRKILHALMINLLYPAVLGTICYSFLSLITHYNDILRNILTFLIILGILLHFIIDFAGTYIIKRYNRITFALDILEIYFFYLTFNLCNYSVRPPNYLAAAFWLSLIHLCDMFYDIVVKSELKYFLRNFISSMSFFVAFLVVWLIHIPSSITGWLIFILIIISDIRLTLLWLIARKIPKSNKIRLN